MRLMEGDYRGIHVIRGCTFGAGTELCEEVNLRFRNLENQFLPEI